MPHIPYNPRPAPAPSSLAPLSSAGPRQDLPELPAPPVPGPSAAVLDDFPVSKGQKASQGGRRPEIERGKPRRRTFSSRPGLSKVSMSDFNPHPAAVSQLLGFQGR